MNFSKYDDIGWGGYERTLQTRLPHFFATPRIMPVKKLSS